MKINIENTFCPVCGYDLKTKLFDYENNRLFFSANITGDICPSCGREFDFNVFPNEESYIKNRIEWIRLGMKFSNEKLNGQYLDSWNPIVQLKNIDVNLLDPSVQEEYRKEIPDIVDILKQYK